MEKGKERACASTEKKNVFNVVREQKAVLIWLTNGMGLEK